MGFRPATQLQPMLPLMAVALLGTGWARPVLAADAEATVYTNPFGTPLAVVYGPPGTSLRVAADLGTRVQRLVNPDPTQLTTLTREMKPEQVVAAGTAITVYTDLRAGAILEYSGTGPRLKISEPWGNGGGGGSDGGSH